MNQDRVLSVKTVAGLLVLRALLGVIAFGLPAQPEDRSTVFAVGGFFVVVTLFFAYFIWQRRRWAAWGAIVVLVLDILLALPAFVVGAGFGVMLGAAIAIALAVAVIVLLRQRPVWSALQ